MKPRLLVACEFSGVVREAFKARGWDAWSCDIIPTEIPGQHIVNDVRNVLDYGWDMMIAHPPCTFLSYAGERWYKVQPDRMYKTVQALKFVRLLMAASIPKIAIENPARNRICKLIRKPDQVIEPWQFGHAMTKATGLWLKALPPLMYTLIDPDPFVNWTKKGKHSHTGKSRSRTFQGIANAMAQQWGRI